MVIFMIMIISHVLCYSGPIPLSEQLPPPPHSLTQQQSTDNKLKLIWGWGGGGSRSAVSQIPTLDPSILSSSITLTDFHLAWKTETLPYSRNSGADRPHRM